MDWDAVRLEFPALARWTYLNTATFGQLPRCATDAVARHWAHRDETACRDFLDWFDDADRLRASLARLIHADADDIAFSPSAAHALSLVVSGLDLSGGAVQEDCLNVVTLQGDFPNQLYLPRLREVPWKDFYESIDRHTKLIAISEVNYASGFRPPLAEISRFIAAIPSAQRPIFFVDGTQSAGALQFDASQTAGRRLRGSRLQVVDLAEWSRLLLYRAAPSRAVATERGRRWRSHHDWRNVDHLHHGVPVFKSSAEKYEAGGLPSALLYAMEASVNLIQSIGSDKIEQRVLGLAGDLRARLRRLGASVDLDIIGLNAENARSQIVSARFPGTDASHLAKALAERRVIVAARQGSLRISPHFYNNESDLDRFEAELKAIL